MLHTANTHHPEWHMKATLQSFWNVLSQVTPSFGSRISQNGLLVSGLFALASVTPGVAVAQDLGAQSSQAGTPSRHTNRISEQEDRTVGRIVGGLVGFGVGKIVEANPLATVLLTVGGAVVGDHAAKTKHRSEAAVPQDGRSAPLGDVDPAVLNAISWTSSGQDAPAQGAGRPIPANLLQGMDSLVLDALARRLLAQNAWKAASEAEVSAAVRPTDVQVAQEKRQAFARFSQAMRENNQAFFQFRNAVGALRSNGYNVHTYLALNRRLSQPVDHRGMVAVDHPAIHDRAYALLASGQAKPVEPTLADLEASVEASVEARSRTAARGAAASMR
jgi:hypothetical protein